MAKLKPDPIGVTELVKFIETESDFDFELRVLNLLRDLGMRCEHGGHYEDPITKKSREFDIRLQVIGGNYYLLAAIECKNLQQYFPLLISCVPRSADEAWHFVAERRDVWTKSHTVCGQDSIYREYGKVGKSTAQVGVAPSGDLTANDAEVYEKWGQCLASLHGMVGKISSLQVGSVAVALPILVVPDETLWCVRYNRDGTRLDDPQQVDHCAVYAGGFEIPFDSSSRFRVSHVEFFTLTGLERFCRKHLCDESSLRSLMLGEHELGR